MVILIILSFIFFPQIVCCCCFFLAEKVNYQACNSACFELENNCFKKICELNVKTSYFSYTISQYQISLLAHRVKSGIIRSYVIYTKMIFFINKQVTLWWKEPSRESMNDFLYHFCCAQSEYLAISLPLSCYAQLHT